MTFIQGTGRDQNTKELRRRNPGARRTFWVGGLHIQSGKKLPVDLEWLRHNYKDVVAHVRTGMLRVVHGDRTYTDAESLAELCGFSGGQEPVQQEPLLPLPTASEPVRAETVQPPESVESESAPQEPELEEPVLELEPEAALEPELESEPDLSEDAISEEAPVVALPEGWRSFSRSKLLDLCEASGINVSDRPSNRILIQRLEAVGA